MPAIVYIKTIDAKDVAVGLAWRLIVCIVVLAESVCRPSVFISTTPGRTTRRGMIATHESIGSCLFRCCLGDDANRES